MNLNFVERDSSGKTKRWLVCSLSSGVELGEVKWYSQWRRYAFFPIGNTIFDSGCLNELQIFVSVETSKQKAG